MLARAIDAGIAKVNVNTELRRAYLGATGDAPRRGSEGERGRAARRADRGSGRVVEEKLAALAGRR